MLTDRNDNRVAGVEAGENFGIAGTNRLNGFGNSGFFQKQRGGGSGGESSLVVDAGGFEEVQVFGGYSIEFIQA